MEKSHIQKIQSPLVSICCLAYNQENYIAKTLDGFVSQQTTFPFEVLVHDDASTDGTANIIMEYASKYPFIKPIIQKENQYSKQVSVQKTFNYPRVKGKYIAYCEGDDYWSDPNKLQKQFNILESNSDISICLHKTMKITKEGRLTNKYFPPFEMSSKRFTIEDYLKSELQEGNWTFQLSSFMVRKDVIDLLVSGTVPFTKAFSVGDFPLIILALTKGDGYYINEDMSHYRVMAGGVMSKLKNSKNINFKINVTNSFIEGYKLLDEYTENKYHTIINHAIKRCEFSNHITLENFDILTTPKYMEIYSKISILKKIAIQIGKISPKLLSIFRSIIKE